MPGRHPDDDLLADLAADVLPAGEARAVENHVLACERCAGLLEDAERLRALLLSGDPGPVPVDVWQRVEAALAAEGASRGGAVGPGPERQRPAVADTAAFQAFVDAPTAPTAPGRAVPPAASSTHASDEPEAAWADDGDPLDDPARWSGPRTGRSARSSAGRSRRDGRDARDTRPRRRGPVLLAAAAAVGAIAVVGTVRLAGPGTSSDASMAAGGASSPPAAAEGSSPAQGPTIVRSERRYREATLAEQARGLLAVADTRAGKALTPGRSRSSPQAPGASDPATPGASDPATLAADAAAADITNPTRLAACLAQLGVSAGRLVAVDLATYEGREAAILLLLPVEGGGHEVWAVERTCGEGSEGALKYTRLRD